MEVFEVPESAYRYKCSHMVIVEDAQRLLKRGTCNNIAMINGHCMKHQAGHVLMRLGEMVNYPELAVGVALVIGEGEMGWRAYAELVNDTGLDRVKVAVASMLGVTIEIINKALYQSA